MSSKEIALDINNNAAIIVALKNSDQRVFELVYRSYFSGLFSYCTQFVSYSESEEIVQDTMLWLWENRNSLIEVLSLKTLLFTIVRNKAINRINHLEIKRKIHSEIIQKYEKQLSDPDFYLENELLSLYEHALDKLPLDFREAYELNRNKEFTHKEIALKLNVSHQTINYRISQALKLLRLALKDYLP